MSFINSIFNRLASGITFPNSPSIIQNRFVSTNQTITSGGTLTIAHGLGVKPKFVIPKLINVSADGSWAINDVLENIVCAGTATTTPLAIYSDATNIYVRYNSNASVFGYVTKSSGAAFSLTNTAWRLILEAYY